MLKATIVLSLVCLRYVYCDSDYNVSADNFVVRFRLSDIAKVINSSTGRLFHAGHGQDMLLPFLMGITLKITSLFPLVLGGMALLGGLTIIKSNIALLLSLILVYQHFVKGKKPFRNGLWEMTKPHLVETPEGHIINSPVDLVYQSDQYPIIDYKKRKFIVN